MDERLIQRDEMQKAYNALCSAEDSLDKALVAGTLRAQLSHIRKELGHMAFPKRDGGGEGTDDK